MRGERLDRRVGTAAAIDRDVRRLTATDFGVGAARAIKLTLMVERRRFGPATPQQRDVFGSAAIAGGGVGPVAVLGLIGIAAAGNDVHREAAVAELIEGRELAGSDRRR